MIYYFMTSIFLWQGKEMYKILTKLALFTFLASIIPCNVYSGEIVFRYPINNQRITNKITKQFLFGQINPPDMPFKINGEPIDVHTNGGFIAYLPVETDENFFIFNAELEDGTTKQIKIRLNKPAKEEKKDPWIKINSNFSDITIMPGDPVHVKAKGTPGKEGFFSRLKNNGKN